MYMMDLPVLQTWFAWTGSVAWVVKQQEEEFCQASKPGPLYPKAARGNLLYHVVLQVMTH